MHALCTHACFVTFWALIVMLATAKPIYACTYTFKTILVSCRGTDNGETIVVGILTLMNGEGRCMHAASDLAVIPYDGSRDPYLCAG